MPVLTPGRWDVPTPQDHATYPGGPGIRPVPAHLLQSQSHRSHHALDPGGRLEAQPARLEPQLQMAEQLALITGQVSGRLDVTLGDQFLPHRVQVLMGRVDLPTQLAPVRGANRFSLGHSRREAHDPAEPTTNPPTILTAGMIGPQHVAAVALQVPQATAATSAQGTQPSFNRRLAIAEELTGTTNLPSADLPGDLLPGRPRPHAQRRHASISAHLGHQTHFPTPAALPLELDPVGSRKRRRDTPGHRQLDRLGPALRRRFGDRQAARSDRTAIAAVQARLDHRTSMQPGARLMGPQAQPLQDGRQPLAAAATFDQGRTKPHRPARRAHLTIPTPRARAPKTPMPAGTPGLPFDRMDGPSFLGRRPIHRAESLEDLFLIGLHHHASHRTLGLVQPLVHGPHDFLDRGSIPLDPDRPFHRHDYIHQGVNSIALLMIDSNKHNADALSTLFSIDLNNLGRT